MRNVPRQYARAILLTGYMQVRRSPAGVAVTTIQEQACRMKRIFAASLALALGACASTGAPPAGPAAPDGLIDRYDEQALRSIMSELEYVVLDARTDGAGRPSMSIEADDMAFEVTGQSCEGQGAARACAGVQLSVQFPENDGVDVDEVMAKANSTLRPAKVFRAGAGVVYERYLIMDGGVSRENLKTEVSVYVEILKVLFGQLSP